MPEKYQLIVAIVTGRDPRTSATHPWRRVSRDGVVTVDRSPGLARDVASRPMTPEERDALARVMLAAVEAGERCQDVGARYGKSKGSVIGAISRYRAAHGITPPAARGGRSAHATSVRNAALVAALAQGATVRELAASHGLSRDTVDTVRQRARASGLLLPAPPPAERRAATVRTARIRLVCEDVERVSLVDVGRGQCRDLGDDGLCCCQPTVSGSSWCQGHLALYTRARTTLRRRAA